MKQIYIAVPVIPQNLRIDRGTETDLMCEIHCFLLAKTTEMEDVTDAILHGSSCQNKIERWWKDLHHRMEMFFKGQLAELQESGEYDSTDSFQRYVSSLSSVLGT